MRAIPLVVFALLVSAIAAADADAVQRELNAAAKSAGAVLGSLQLSSHALSIPKSQSLAHAFAAQQTASGSSTCNQQQFADATARVLQACPSLSGLVSGSTAPEEFLPGFCGSECYNVLATELTKNIGCLDGTTLFLLGFVQTCQTRPQCFSEGFIGVQARLQKECGILLKSPTQLDNFTDAAIKDARTACAGTCLTRQVALMRQFPECIRDERTNEPLPVAALTGFMESLCSQESGEYCAVTLKAFGKMDCSSSCAKSGSWCTSSCESPVLTTERLNQLCSPCTAKLVKNLPALGAKGGSLGGAVGTFCATAKGGLGNETNPFCYPLAVTALTTIMSMSQPTNTSVAAACGGFTGRCVDRTLASLASMSKDAAYAAFDYCIPSSTTAFCQSRLESALRSAEQLRVQGAIMCARNAGGDYCLWHTVQLGVALKTGACSSLTTALPAAGCCLPAINDVMRLDGNYPASYLPAGKRTINATMGTRVYSTTFTSTPMYSMPMVDRSQQPASAFLLCPNVANTSSFWEQVEKPCPPMTPLANLTRTAVNLPLAWSQLARDPALVERVKRALRADTAAAMGVPVGAIVNDSLAEDRTTKVQLRTTASIRQTSGTDSGTAYVFSVDAESPADSKAAVARMQASMRANTMTTPNTAATVEADCEQCMDARSSSLAQATTVVETPAPVSPSSAASLAVGAAAVAAVLVLVL